MTTTMTERTPFRDRLIEEGTALVSAAGELDLAVRLIGGVGIRLRVGDRYDPALLRPFRDLDVIVRQRDGRSLDRLLAARGWEPAREFNALNGSRRLLFHDPLSDAQVDVFVGTFEMCHTLPLADALDRPGPALPLTELLMTKLQIVELNAKDRNDCYAILNAGEIVAGDPSQLEPVRLARLTARDWGLHHTFELNLERLRNGLADGLLAPDRAALVRLRVDAIASAMEQEPKSRAWKLRARIGERKRWYDEPEEVDREAGDT